MRTIFYPHTHILLDSMKELVSTLTESITLSHILASWTARRRFIPLGSQALRWLYCQAIQRLWFKMDVYLTVCRSGRARSLRVLPLNATQMLSRAWLRAPRGSEYARKSADGLRRQVVKAISQLQRLLRARNGQSIQSQTTLQRAVPLRIAVAAMARGRVTMVVVA